MKYAYQRTGAPLLSWDRAPPQQSRASDAKALGCGCTASLGSLGDDTLGASSAMPLPRAGAPEPIGAIPVVDGIANALTPVFGTATTPVVLGGLAIGAYFLLKKLKK